jgi:hypothetical protein
MLSCGCIGQRATGPVLSDPQFVIKAACDEDAPEDIVGIATDAKV